MREKELVIKLPESIWVAIQNGEYCGILDDRTYNVIKNGTPLEKHDEEVIKETVESIWGKPPYTEMLDKIRAEIIWYRDNRLSYEANSETIELTNYYLTIIDKYKAEESEDI